MAGAHVAGARLRGDRLTRALAAAAMAWLLVVLGLVAVHIFVPQRTGPIALTEIFEPYLLLTVLIAAPLAWRFRRPTGRPVGRLAVVALIIVAALRYVPAWVSLPSAPTGDQLSAMTWNLLAGPEAGQRALEGILRSDADVIGLQELQPAAADAIASDPTLAQRLPYRSLSPDRTVLGVGLLSRYPITDVVTSADPPFLRAVIEHPAAGSITVFVVHPPLPGTFQSIAGAPVSIRTAERDAAIALIRSMVQAEAQVGRPVLVIGDMNMTEREPIYAEFTQGAMRDAHLDAGIGPGFTWRPEGIAGVPFGVLRIDYVFAVGGFQPKSTFVDCELPSDHCRLEATLSFLQPRVR
ncbi:MAG: endonuclease/exonuclease/phosphatase family protein [Candidatus Limnocylindrales bacterium]